MDVPPIVHEAVHWLGTPYSWGGGNDKGPTRGSGRGARTVGFDCSGFIRFLFARLGIRIPRNTYQQWRAGRPVSRRDLRPGDAVFFHMGKLGPEHVGLFIGNNRFIHAPSTGDVVKISSMDTRYYRNAYVGARSYRA